MSDPFRFSHRLRVRWVEADMQGVVFNGHYLTYFDIGITEYWRELGQGNLQTLMPIIERMFVVRSLCEYRSPARFDDELDVKVRTLRLGRSSLTIGFRIDRGDEELVSGENVYVYAEEGASAPLPDVLRSLILGYEQTAPEA